MDDTDGTKPDAQRESIVVNPQLKHMLNKNGCMTLEQAAALIDMLKNPRTLSTEQRVLRAFGVIE